MRAPPLQIPMQDSRGYITQEWQEFFTAAFMLMSSLEFSGPTAGRPAKNVFVGMRYFDTDLGYLISVKSIKPTVWVDGAGNTV